MVKRPQANPSLPPPGSKNPAHTTSQNQPDLFDERGTVKPPRATRQSAPPALPPPGMLSDGELCERVRRAGPANVEAVCGEVASRSLEAAVPALEALWLRFTGFGNKKPLREQLAILNTLAQLGGTNARSALRRIVLWKALPASLLPAALRAAADAELALPATFVSAFLDHADAAVRGAAFALADRAGVPGDRLRDGLFDLSATNRRLAATALGLRGDPQARQPLLDLLERAPSKEIIEAVAAIWDEDAIVLLGRCARVHPTLAETVLDRLGDIENPRAQVVARNLETWIEDSKSGSA